MKVWLCRKSRIAVLYMVEALRYLSLGTPYQIRMQTYSPERAWHSANKFANAELVH